MRRRWFQRLPFFAQVRGSHLSTLLIAVNVGLLLLATCGIAWIAMRLLQGFADEQALQRVAQGSALGRQEVYRVSDGTLMTAQLLAERPTLRRLLESDDRVALQQFIEQFGTTSRLDGIAILDGSRVLAQYGVVDPTMLSATQEQTFLGGLTGQPWLVAGAWSPILSHDGTYALVTRVLDAGFAEQLSRDVGLELRIVPAGAIDSNSGTRQRALTTGQQVTARDDMRDVYVTDTPLSAPSGTIVGVIESVLPTGTVTGSLTRLTTTLVLLALAVAAIAAVVSFLVGRRLGRPLFALTTAASRIGNGDLLTPVPRVASAEIGTLSNALEEMRTQLLDLTANLRHQQAEAQAIVQGITEGVFSVDRQRRIQFLNSQAAAMLDIDAQQAVGRFCGDVLRPIGPGGERPCAEHCPIVHARFRGNARATEHLTLANGERRTVVITSAPTSGERQVQVIRDETELEATRRLRDAILANISHEFRTPLSAQLASIELLLDQLDQLDVADIGRLIVSLQRGTLRLTQLIDNLLESARIESGQYRIRQSAVALDEVVEEALALTQPLLDQRDQQVEIDLPFPMPPVRGDTRRLTQVLVNLLANANKYAPAGSTITIGGDVGDETASVWVEDQGPGLPAGGPSLFTRFVRSAYDEPEQSGTGLGLWLVKAIVEKHEGQVEAHSTEQGTRMRVILPIEHNHENTRR